jgi:GDPmannose 4,6-dehydratase
VTRKISQGLANILQGLQRCLYLGNIDALRDWGHAKDYVRMQWMMLQQDKPEDFVIATGKQYSLLQFINWTAEALGMQLHWEGDGVHEIGNWVNRSCRESADVYDLIPIVLIDPRYFRPTDVETLRGDATKAKSKLGLVPEISAQEMCKEMVAHDLLQAKQQALLKTEEYKVNVSVE